MIPTPQVRVGGSCRPHTIVAGGSTTGQLRVYCCDTIVLTMVHLDCFATAPLAYARGSRTYFRVEAVRLFSYRISATLHYRCSRTLSFLRRRQGAHLLEHHGTSRRQAQTRSGGTVGFTQYWACIPAGALTWGTSGVVISSRLGLGIAARSRLCFTS